MLSMIGTARMVLEKSGVYCWSQNYADTRIAINTKILVLIVHSQDSIFFFFYEIVGTAKLITIVLNVLCIRRVISLIFKLFDMII